MKCANCGKIISKGEQFCMDCGAPVKKKRKPGIFIVLLILLIGAAVFLIYRNTHSYRSVKVDEYDGKVELERKGKDEDIFEGLKLIPDDCVTTGKNGKILLYIDSDKELLASEDTRFSINATGNKKKGKVTIDLEYGTALATIDEELDENSEFKIKTPNATCSVRGTKYKVAYSRSTHVTRVDVYRGVVRVKAGSNTLDVKAGESVEVVNDVITLVPQTAATVTPTPTPVPAAAQPAPAQTAAATPTPAPTATPLPAQTVTDAWRSQYLTAINAGKLGKIDKAAVIYLDGDDIPEIAIQHKQTSNAAGGNYESVYTLKNGQTIESRDGYYLKYWERGNEFCMLCDWNGYILFTLTGGTYSILDDNYQEFNDGTLTDVDYDMTEAELIAFLSGGAAAGTQQPDTGNNGNEFAAYQTLSGTWKTEISNMYFGITLRQDGTATMGHYKYETDGTYTYDGNRLVITSNTYEDVWIFEKDGNNFRSMPGTTNDFVYGGTSHVFKK